MQEDEREAVVVVPLRVIVAVVRIQRVVVVVAARPEEIEVTIGLYKTPSMAPPIEYSLGCL